MTNVACESKLRSIVRSSMHPCPGYWVVIGFVVVYYVWYAMHLVQELDVGTVQNNVLNFSKLF